MDTIVPLPFRHKLNYFVFIQKFERFIFIYVKILINKIFNCHGFKSQTFIVMVRTLDLQGQGFNTKVV
jgi:hypothetical protein